jgi:NifU-like protein involved in Fe-S cluster formation
MNSNQIRDALGCLPKEHNHCALLAVKTLHKAISIYKKQRGK